MAADAAVDAVVDIVRASGVRSVYTLNYSIVSQKIGTADATASGFAFAITDKDEAGINVGEITVATALIATDLWSIR